MRTHQKAKNFAVALAKHAADGFKIVEPEVYMHRLSICNTNKCGYRDKNICIHEKCGCYLDKKAWWNSESCPIDLW